MGRNKHEGRKRLSMKNVNDQAWRTEMTKHKERKRPSMKDGNDQT